jgi:drug/metabolite transporter (DMT)-like permease
VGLRAHPDRAALGFAALTAVGIALYNVADARGVRLAPAPWTFIVWLFICDCLCISAYALMRRGSALLIVTMRSQWRLGAAAGLLSILSFGAALYGFSIAETARVSALRETAVVFAAVMGALWLGEGFGPRRILSAIVMAAGLALMQAG